jgi:copper(I)-binding protein
MRGAATAGRLRVALLVALLGGCTYFPTVAEVGSPRLEPRNGRLVRIEGGAICYLELSNTGKYDDTLVAVESGVARRIEVITPKGTSSGVIVIPGQSSLAFDPGGFRIVLSELIQPLTPGDGVIVTLIFAKSGRIGVVSVVE